MASSAAASSSRIPRSTPSVFSRLTAPRPVRPKPVTAITASSGAKAAPNSNGNRTGKVTSLPPVKRAGTGLPKPVSKTQAVAKASPTFARAGTETRAKAQTKVAAYMRPTTSSVTRTSPPPSAAEPAKPAVPARRSTTPPMKSTPASSTAARAARKVSPPTKPVTPKSAVSKPTPKPVALVLSSSKVPPPVGRKATKAPAVARPKVAAVAAKLQTAPPSSRSNASSEPAVVPLKSCLRTRKFWHSEPRSVSFPEGKALKAEKAFKRQDSVATISLGKQRKPTPRCIPEKSRHDSTPLEMCRPKARDSIWVQKEDGTRDEEYMRWYFPGPNLMGRAGCTRCVGREGECTNPKPFEWIEAWKVKRSNIPDTF